MNLTKYNVILDNCGTRTVFEVVKFNKLLRKYTFNWKKIILKRHHPFIEAYIECNGNMSTIGQRLKYSTADLRAIFLRIQSQFELYDEDNSLTFMDMIVSVYGLPIISGDLNFAEYIQDKKEQTKLTKEYVLEKFVGEEMDFNADSADSINSINSVDSVEESNIEDVEEIVQVSKYASLKDVVKTLKEYIDKNPTAKRHDKLIKYANEFNKLEDISIISELINKKAYKGLLGLMDGKTLNEIACDIGSSTDYLTYTILGYGKPRTKSEMGILRVLDTSI